MKVIREKELCSRKGRRAVLQELSDDPMKFCIQYRGGGHYFPCEPLALAYAAGRGWIPMPQWNECCTLCPAVKSCTVDV